MAKLNTDSATKLYNAVKDAGFDIGDYNAYMTKLQSDPTNADNLYKALHGAGFDIGSDYASKLYSNATPLPNLFDFGKKTESKMPAMPSVDNGFSITGNKKTVIPTSQGKPLTDEEAKKVIYGNVPGTTKIGDVSLPSWQLEQKLINQTKFKKDKGEVSEQQDMERSLPANFSFTNSVKDATDHQVYHDNKQQLSANPDHESVNPIKAGPVGEQKPQSVYDDYTANIKGAPFVYNREDIEKQDEEILLPPEDLERIAKMRNPGKFDREREMAIKNYEADKEEKRLKEYYKSPEGRNEYNAHINYLNKAQELVNKADADLKQREIAFKQKRSRLYSPFYSGSEQEYIDNDRQKNVLDLERSKIEEAKNAFSAYKQGKYDGTLKQILGTVQREGGNTLEDIASFGVAPLLRDLKYKQIADKKSKGERLTEDESKVLNTASMAKYVSDTFGERTFAQEATSGILQSLPYMASFIASDGLLSGISKGIGKGVEKAGLKSVTKAGIKEAGQLGVKGLEGGISKNLARSLGAVNDVVDATTKMAVFTAIDPRTYDKAIQNMNGDAGYDINEQGNIVYTGQKDSMDFTSALTNAYISQGIENLSEAAGEGFKPLSKAFSSVLNKTTPDLARVLKNNKFFTWTGDLAEKAKFNGTLGEFMEEQIATVGHSLAGDGQGQWSDLIDPRQQLLTLVTVMAVGSGGWIANQTGNTIQKIAITKEKNISEKEFDSFFGADGNELKNIFNTAPVGVQQDLIKTILQDENVDENAKKAAYNYYVANTRYQSYKGTNDQKIDDATADATNFVGAITHAESGNVIEARLHGVDKPINITKGNIVLKGDGSVDMENSDKTFFYKTPDGVLHVGNIEFIEGINSVVPAQEAIDKSVQPVREQLENENAPEYGIGKKAVIVDNTDPQNPSNAIVTITGRDENGNYKVQRDMGNGQVQPGIVQPREILPQFAGVLDAENAAVDYIDPQTGETMTGMLELDTPDKQMMFANGYATIDGKQISFENIHGLVDNGQLTVDNEKQNVDETNGLQAAEAGNTQSELEQGRNGEAIQEIENQEPRAKSQESPEGDLPLTPKGEQEIPQDEKGNLLFEQARPELTIQFLKDNFETEEIVPTVVARIKAINKEIAKQEAFKPTGNIQKDALVKQAKRQALNALNEQLGYWKDILEQVTPRNYKPKNETVAQRDARWGEPTSLREMIIRKFIGGVKLRWDDETSADGTVISRGLGGEYRYSNDERKAHFNFLAANGVTPEQLAHSLWQANAYEAGQFEDMPLYGMDTQEILSEILDVMNSYRSVGEMIDSVDEIRDQYTAQEQAYIATLVASEENQKNLQETAQNEIDDDTFAELAGLVDLTEEQQNELKNLQNDVTNRGTRETVIGSDNTTGSQKPGEEKQGDTRALANGTADAGGNNAGDRGFEGNSEKQPIGKLGTGADVYFDKSGIRVNAQSNSDKILLNITLKGETFADAFEFDTPEEAVSVAETLYKLYPKGIPNALLIKDVVESIKSDLGIEPVEQLTKAEQDTADLDKQRKPYAEYKDTPEAAELAEQPLEKVKGITVINEEDNGKTLVYGTKSVQTKLSVKNYTAQEIKEELDFEIKKRNDALVELQQNERLLSITPIGKDYEGLKKLISDNKKLIESTKVTIPWLEQKLKEANGNISSGNKLPEQDTADLDKQRKPYAEYKDTPAAIESQEPRAKSQDVVDNKLQTYDAAVGIQERVQIGTEIIRELEAAHGLEASIIAGSHQEMADVYPEFNQKDRNFVLDGNVSGCYYNGKLAIDIAGCHNVRVLIGSLVHENVHRVVKENYTAEELESIHDQIPLSELKYVPVEDRTSKQRIADEWLAYTTESLLENNTVDDILSGNVQNWGTLSPYTQEQITNILNTQRNGKSKSRTTTPERKGRSNRNNAATGRAGEIQTVSEATGEGAEANQPGTTTGDTGRSISGLTAVSELGKLQPGQSIADFAKEVSEKNTSNNEERALFRRIQEENPLVVLHNISEQSLLRAIDGDGLIAPSIAITNVNNPYTDFGEITLVGKKEMIDPKSGEVKVFAGDVYSPTVPRPKYKVDSKSLQKWRSEIANKAFDKSKEVSSLINNSLNDYNNFVKDLSSNSAQSIVKNESNNLGLKLAYLIENNISFKVPTKIKEFSFHGYTPSLTSEQIDTGKSIYEKMKKEYDDTKGNLSESTKQEIIDYITNTLVVPASEKSVNLFKRLKEKSNGALTEDWIMQKQKEAFDNIHDKIVRWPDMEMRDLYNLLYPKTILDESALRDAINKKVSNKAFSEWLNTKIINLQGEKYFESGNKKVSYTPENILDHMIGKTRGQEEGMTFGMNKAKSFGINQFNDIPSIQAMRGNIISKQQMNDIDEAYKAEYFELADKLKYKYSDRWSALDDLGKALADYYKGYSVKEALRRNDYGIQGESYFKDFADRLKSNPVDYFEAKMQRIVPISEFYGAIVPKETSKELVSKLKENGIQVKKYSTKEERLEQTINITKSDDIRFRRKPEAFDTAKTTEEKYEAGKGVVDYVETLFDLPKAVVVGSNNDMVDAINAIKYTPGLEEAAQRFELGGVYIYGQVFVNTQYQKNAVDLQKSWLHETTHLAIRKSIKPSELREAVKGFSETETILPEGYEDQNEYIQKEEMVTHAAQNLLDNHSIEDIANGKVDLSLYSASMQNVLKTVINYITNGKFNENQNVGTGEGQSRNGIYDTETARSLDSHAEKGNGRTELLRGIGETERVREGVLPEQITIAGKQRSTTNSLGQPIHPTEAGVRNFWKWFGDSKVVDKQGRPLVVYHGSISDFNEFKLMDSDVFGTKFGHFFTPDKDIAQSFADRAENGVLYATYLKLEHPKKINGFFWDSYSRYKGADASLRKQSPKEYTGDVELPDFKKFREQLQAEGNDGVVLNNISIQGEKTRIVKTPQYIVFEPTQIKSATGNSGEFGAEDADIRHQIIGEKGAGALDASTSSATEATSRLDNLRVAKEMEAKTVDNGDGTDRGFTAQEIRLATGWEKGVDGLWRYEVPDGEIRKDVLKELKTNSTLANQDVTFDLVTYRKHDNGFDISLRKKGATNTNEFVDYNNLSVNELKSIIDNDSVTDKILNGEGGESFMGENWDDAKEFKTEFTTFITGGETLERVVDNKQLFEAYPALKDVIVVFDKSKGLNASYEERGDQKIIRIGAVWNQTKSTLIHEIQHAIQEIEGFAKGGSVDSMQQSGEELISMVEDIENLIRIAEKNNVDLKTAYENTKGIWKNEQVVEYNSNKTIDEVKSVLKTIKSSTLSPLEQYRRLAGEVEARNASARMNMSEEERRNTLIAETADVAPEDQIVLMDVLGVSESRPLTPKGEQAPKSPKGDLPATINVDGVERPTTNSNGKPIHGTEEGIRNFWKWFGDSKVVDKDGRPLVVYHGTKHDFTEFGKGKTGFMTKSLRTFYFSPSEEYANTFGSKYGGVNMPVYLSIQKLKRVSHDVIEDVGYWASDKQLDEFEAMGYDGLIDYKKEQIVALHPTQIKSATGNSGEFDAEDADIRFQIQGYKGSRTTPEYYKQAQSLDDLFGIGKPVHDKKGGEPISEYYKRVKAWSVANNPQAWGEADRQEAADYIAGKTPDSYEAKAQAAQAAAQAAGATVVDEPKPVFQQDGHTMENVTDFARRVVAWREQRFINGIVRAEREAEAREAVEQGFTPMDHETARMELDMQLRTVYDSLGKLIGKQPAKKMERLLGNKEMWADSLLPVKTFLDYLRSRGVKIPDIDDYYLQATALQGKNDTGFNNYVRKYQKPVNKWIHDTMKATGFKYRDIENYVFLKHGVERNEFFKKDGKHQKADYAGVYAIAAELYAKDNGIPFDPKEKNEIGKVLKEYANANGITLNETSESGIYDELFANKKEAVEQAQVEKNRAFFDKIVNDYITDFEDTVNLEGRSIDDFWAKLNDANNFSLDTMADAGIITRTQADEIKSRYQYFIPLRGHEVEAEKTYEYSPDAGVFFSNPAIKAHGRISRAEHPFSYIAQMAQSAVVMKNNNDLKKTMLRLARKDKTGLFSVNRTWYIKTGTDAEGKDIWEEAEITADEFDELNRAEWVAWNERMKELEKEGRAKQFTKGVDLDGLFIKKKQKKQHAITVIENGEEYQVYINANPRISRAINGLNKTKEGEISRFFSSIKGMIGLNVTSRNPSFMAANFSRDIGFAASILPAKEGGIYAAKFLSNIGIAGKELVQYQMNPDTAPQHVREFFDNGGETGFSHLWELQDMQKQIDKAVAQGMSASKAWEAIVKPIDIANKIVENTTRLAVYKTSRESGRTVERSISDAKEVTLNFNRSGAGGGIIDFIRPAYLFVNAGIQALSNFIKVYKEHPWKMTGVILSYMMSGLLMPVINSFLLQLSGDDEDEYWNLPDYDRQNNLCIWNPITIEAIGLEKGFLKVPYAQQLRVFHRMGDNVAAHLWNKKPMSEAMVNVGAGLLDLIPANPSGPITVSWAEGMPDAVKPFFQVWANKTFTGAAIAKDESFMKAGVPQWRQVRTNRANEPKAPAGIIWLSAELNAALGGDQYRSAGAFEKEVLNPDKLNHLARGYFGGVYTTASSIVESVTNKDILKGVSPITDRFYIGQKDLEEKTTGGNLQNAYNKIDEAEQRVNQFKQIVEDLKDRKIDTIQYVKDTVNYDLGSAKTINNLGKRLRDINKVLKEDQYLPEDSLQKYRSAQQIILKMIENTELKPVKRK